MTDAPRDVRDRLGEALRRQQGWATHDWHEATRSERVFWGRQADSLLALAASCGLKIVPDDGDTK